MAVMAAGAVGGYFGGRTAAAGHRSLGAMFSSSRFAKARSTTRGFPMRLLIALILSSGIALASIPASASPASTTFGGSICPVDEGPAGCGG